MSRRRLVRPRGERLGLGTNGCAIVVHGADGLACALEVAEHLGLGEVSIVDGVRVDRVLQVTTLTAATSDRHFMNDCVRLPCTKGGTVAARFAHRSRLRRAYDVNLRIFRISRAFFALDIEINKDASCAAISGRCDVCLSE